VSPLTRELFATPWSFAGRPGHRKAYQRTTQKENPAAPLIRRGSRPPLPRGVSDAGAAERYQWGIQRKTPPLDATRGGGSGPVKGLVGTKATLPGSPCSVAPARGFRGSKENASVAIRYGAGSHSEVRLNLVMTRHGAAHGALPDGLTLHRSGAYFCTQLGLYLPNSRSIFLRLGPAFLRALFTADFDFPVFLDS